MKKILFPTDFSPTALNAFNYALELVNELDAQIDLIHVYHLPISEVAALSADYIQNLMDEKVAWVDQQFGEFVKGKDADIINRVKGIYGVFPAIEIVEFADNENYDYIIMGTKGATNRLDNLMGSITSRVMMKAHCPVISIPFEANFRPICNIAYTTTLAQKNKHAVEQLMEFAGEHGAIIHFVHINTKSNEGIKKDTIEVRKAPVQFTDFTIINNYSVTDGLNKYVAENGTDMLALYIPNRRLWERIFHQSVSKKMALHTQIPLIVFHQ